MVYLASGITYLNGISYTGWIKNWTGFEFEMAFNFAKQRLVLRPRFMYIVTHKPCTMMKKFLNSNFDIWLEYLVGFKYIAQNFKQFVVVF